jgi:hypothetical protein
MQQSKLMILSAGIGMALSPESTSAARADILVDVYEYAGNALGTNADKPTLNGASFVIGGITQFSNPAEANNVPDSVPGGTFNGAPFDLYYVEGNVSPSVLDVHLNRAFGVPPVPEPSTWAMLLIGFAGIGFAGYRRFQREKFQGHVITPQTPTAVM